MVCDFRQKDFQMTESKPNAVASGKLVFHKAELQSLCEPSPRTQLFDSAASISKWLYIPIAGEHTVQKSIYFYLKGSKMVTPIRQRESTNK